MTAEGDGFLYFPDPRRERAKRTMGGFLLVGGGGLGCLFLVIGLLVGPLYSANLAQDPLAEAIPAALFPALALVFGLGSVGLALWLLRRPDRGWLALTRNELVLVSGRKSTVLLLEDITQLSARRQVATTGGGHWIVQIADRSGESLDLEVGEPGYLATYDVGSILQDLLPRLPKEANIDPQIYRYLETGRLADEANDIHP